jgi:thioredoxin 1
MLKTLILGLLLFSFIPMGFGEEVSSYEEALKVSKEKDKEIFLYFGAKWCGYCTKMDKVLKDKEVVRRMEDLVILKLDLDENKDLAKKHGVKTIPDYMIMNKNEEIVKRHTGYKNKEEFMDWLE